MAIINIFCKFKNTSVQVSAKKLEKRLKMRAIDDTIIAYTNLNCTEDCDEKTCRQRGGYESYLENPNK